MSQLYTRMVHGTVNWLTPRRLALYPPHIPILLISVWALNQIFGQGLMDASGKIIGSDFLAFYNAGQFFLSNRMPDLYNFHDQYVFQSRFLTGSFYPFLNPPFTAALFSFFAFDDYLEGLIAWWGIGFLSLVLSVYLCRREMPGLQRYSTSTLLLMSFFFYPTLAWFTYGQNTPMSLLIYTGFFVLIRRGKDFFAGLALGLLSYKPQLAIGLLALLLFNHRWSALGGVLASCGVLVGASYILSPEAMRRYLELAVSFPALLRLNPDPGSIKSLLLTDAPIEYATWGIQSFFGLSVLLLDNIGFRMADILSVLLNAAGLIFLLALWKKISWLPGTPSWDRAMAVTFTMGLLISPHLFIYDLLLFLLPLSIVWNCYPQGLSGRALDGGPILFWSALVYIFSFIGSYLTFAQLRLFSILGFPTIAIQVNTIVLLCWTMALADTALNSKKLSASI